jgi:uncharacterized membrane-anchored protein YitT (DUF2179 family)
MLNRINHIINSIIVGANNNVNGQPISRFRIAKHFKQLKISIRVGISNFVLICLGILSAAFGLEGFLIPNGFIDGGATGLSLLSYKLTQVPFGILLLVINFPFLLLAYRIIGADFTVKAGLSIIGLALAASNIHFPQITNDKLLVAVFGGFFLGAGIGLAIRGGSILDGTEVVAIALSRRLGITIGDVIMLLNVIIFSSAAYLLGIETALYSMITYLAASKTLDYVIEGIEEYTGVTIISVKNKEIGDMIVEKIGRGFTVYKGETGFGKQGYKHDQNIVFTVITRLEISKLKAEIEKIDTYAFVVMHSIKDTKGGMIKKRMFKH